LFLSEGSDLRPFKDRESRELGEFREIHVLGPLLVCVFVVVRVGDDGREDKCAVEFEGDICRRLDGDELVGETAEGEEGEVLCVGVEV
jgi:hypothetical protein